MIENVKRGAAWLDVNYPGWANRIDLSILNMGSYFECICGQLEIGDEPRVSGEEESTGGWFCPTLYCDYQLGFVPVRDSSSVEWDELASLWVTEIESRWTPINEGLTATAV